MKEYKVRVFESGREEWFLNGKLHREDGPAVEDSNGTTLWYLYGNPHREDGPAVVWKDGSKEWFRHGKLHREDGPAVEYILPIKSGRKK